MPADLAAGDLRQRKGSGDGGGFLGLQFPFPKRWASGGLNHLEFTLVRAGSSAAAPWR